MTYCPDLRERVVRAVGQGRPLAEVARTYGVERSAIRAWRERAARGKLAPGPTPSRRHTQLTDDGLATLRCEVMARPDLTLRERQSKPSVHVAESTVHRALRKLGLSFKKSR